MTRVICAIAAFLPAFAILAAPAPQNYFMGFAKPVDPHRDCKFTRDKDALTIEMPGTDHDYDPLRERLNAPRLLRDLEGDFDMQVKVRIDCRPSERSSVDEKPSCVAIGFLLIPPEKSSITCIRLEYGVARQGIGEDGYAAFIHKDIKNGYSNAIWDRKWKNWPLTEKTRHAYLRLKRRKEFFYPSISPDGEKWTSLVGGAGFDSIPAKLKVGLAAYSTSTDSSKVRFDQFKLTQDAKKKR